MEGESEQLGAQASLISSARSAASLLGRRSHWLCFWLQPPAPVLFLVSVALGQADRCSLPARLAAGSAQQSIAACAHAAGGPV